MIGLRGLRAGKITFDPVAQTGHQRNRAPQHDDHRQQQHQEPFAQRIAGAASTPGVCLNHPIAANGGVCGAARSLLGSAWPSLSASRAWPYLAGWRSSLASTPVSRVVILIVPAALAIVPLPGLRARSPLRRIQRPAGTTIAASLPTAASALILIAKAAGAPIRWSDGPAVCRTTAWRRGIAVVGAATIAASAAHWPGWASALGRYGAVGCVPTIDSL